MKKQKSDAQTKNLAKGMERLAMGIEKSNSMWFMAARGIIYGVFTVIGATIVAAVLLGVLAKTINTASDIPIIGDIIDKTQVESLLQK